MLDGFEHISEGVDNLRVCLGQFRLGFDQASGWWLDQICGELGKSWVWATCRLASATLGVVPSIYGVGLAKFGLRSTDSGMRLTSVGRVRANSLCVRSQSANRLLHTTACRIRRSPKPAFLPTDGWNAPYFAQVGDTKRVGRNECALDRVEWRKSFRGCGACREVTRRVRSWVVCMFGDKYARQADCQTRLCGERALCRQASS